MGVPYNGTTHYDFSVKILTMGGECRALELIADLALAEDDHSEAAVTLRNLAFLAPQLSIEGIADEAITPAFLLDNLATDDYLQVTLLIDELRKKRIAAGESQPKTTASDDITA